MLCSIELGALITCAVCASYIFLIDAWPQNYIAGKPWSVTVMSVWFWSMVICAVVGCTRQWYERKMCVDDDGDISPCALLHVPGIDI